jgi:hypothetical protein
VVEIDLADSTMRLHDPARFELESGSWQPVRFQDNHPIVPARFAGGDGLFRLDVGAAGGPHGNVVFHRPAVEALNLLPADATEGQLGGATVAVGTIDWFELAGVRFDTPEVAFGQDESGIFADPHTTGNIGVGFLREFRIVFDYSRERVALVPKKFRGTSPLINP